LIPIAWGIGVIYLGELGAIEHGAAEALAGVLEPHIDFFGGTIGHHAFDAVCEAVFGE